MAIQEISLKLPNRPGQLAAVLRLFAQDRINLAAVSVDSSGTRGHIRLVVSNPVRALEILRDEGFAVESRELLAIQLEDRPGSLLEALDVLAGSHVNILSIAILVAREGNHVIVALGVNDLAKGRRALSEAGFLSAGAERLVSNADLLGVTPTIPSESVGLLL